MGEEVKQEETKQEEKPVVEEENKEEKPAEEEEKKPAEEEPPKPPPVVVVLHVDMHCVGCAKKIERSIMKCRGVEAVAIDMGTNQITVKGIVDPQALCVRIQKKTKRRAKIISPLPATEGEPIPQVVTSQVSGPITVELNVNMHCEACALQLKKKILKMRGVQTAETELSTGKVTVTGTMDAERLVDYVYRRTKKQARIVPQPELEPEPLKEEGKKDEGGEKPAEEAAKPADDEKKEENGEKKQEEESGEKKDEEKKEDGNNGEQGQSNEEKGGGNNDEQVHKEDEIVEAHHNEETMKKMMYYYPPYYHPPPRNYPPLYVIERVPAPQLFSDENPNACCIS
ncbi:hypothetical protein C5167_032566 [Papaver somniferum]|uniref:HMA domain-containing protein n=1 Tax=Papaver somniferum TaxID=3469 RepID=A0A4Y7KAU5_PAPSO|nr:heavy metal-associated isoprenylated plant protein 9-like [Papaver somniferum]RZC69462.1 hypothetical protein C5167_032566 [Papaver somniferum]